MKINFIPWRGCYDTEGAENMKQRKMRIVLMELAIVVGVLLAVGLATALWPVISQHMVIRVF